MGLPSLCPAHKPMARAMVITFILKRWKLHPGKLSKLLKSHTWSGTEQVDFTLMLMSITRLDKTAMPHQGGWQENLGAFLDSPYSARVLFRQSSSAGLEQTRAEHPSRATAVLVGSWASQTLAAARGKGMLGLLCNFLPLGSRAGPSISSSRYRPWCMQFHWIRIGFGLWLRQHNQQFLKIDFNF